MMTTGRVPAARAENRRLELRGEEEFLLRDHLHRFVPLEVMRGRSRDRRCRDDGDESMQLADYRPWQTTSTSAGWPDFTTSAARFSAGPSFAGSVTGPSAHTPIDCASFA